MNFDWQTDEDEKQWEQEQPPPIVSRRPRRRWLFLLLAGVAIIFASFALYRRFNQQVEQVTSATEQQVVDSYHVLRRADEEQDRGLFFLVVSGRDPAWTNSQRDLLLENLLFDRRPLGLAAVPDASEVISVSLAPELTSAELVYEQDYLVAASGGLSQTVSLRQTAVFRQGPGRWLYAPPAANFWGSPVTIEHEDLSLIAPGRDEVIARRLAGDLAEAIAEACVLVTASQLDCPHLTVQFDTDPTSLLATAVPTRLLHAGQRIRLPAPSLIGLPIDEAGYQALRQSYTVWVVARLLNEAAGWQCCDRLYFYQAVLDWHLAQLDVRAWPLTSADYETLIDRPQRYSELVQFWSELDRPIPSEDERRQIYAFIEFVLYRSSATSFVQQGRLSEASSLMNWLLPQLGGFEEDVLLAREWQLFAYERSLSAQRPPPVPLPDEEITLMCASHPEAPADGLYDLYDYNLAADSYVRTWILRPITFITSLPNQLDILTVQEEERNGERWRQFWLYRAGRPVAEFLLDSEPHWSYFGSHPYGFQLVLSYYGEDFVRQFALVDQMRCNLANCIWQELPGRPVWSPDGTRLLVAGVDDVTGYPTIWYGDGRGRSLNQLGTGDLPFWPDNETFGYVELDFEANATGSGLIFQLIVLRHRQFIETVVSNETLREVAPAEMRPNGLYITGIYPIPDGSGRLLIRGIDWSSGEQPDGTLFFMVDRQGENYSWLWRSDMLIFSDATFSPDGRWLAMDGADQLGLSRTIYLYQLEQNRTVPLHLERFSSSYGWSADGQWFWQVQNELLYLIAPDYDYRIVRPLPLAGCLMAAAAPG